MSGQGHINFLWTQEVFDESRKSLTSRFPDNSVKIKQMFERIMTHFYDGEVRGFESLIGTLGCRDKDDEHVLAGAIHGKANILLTYNTRDFPLKLSTNLVILHPDIFLISWLEVNPELGVSLLAKWLERFENPPIDARAAEYLINKIDCPMLANFIRRKAKSIDAQIHRLRSFGSS
jgi:predicted nucleic acid-binding protein